MNDSEGTSLRGRDILLVGGGSGIAKEIARKALSSGAVVTLAGRDLDRLRQTAEELGDGAKTAAVDLTDEASIVALAETVDGLDYLVILASAPANGPLQDLQRTDIDSAFAAKVTGPILLLKHLAGLIRPDGAVLLFSGLMAWRPAPGRVVMATANGAVSFLAAALAVELAPVRVNALSPGIVDSGAWDRLGAAKDALFESTAATVPARRIGQPSDIASAALLALTNPFLTGTTLHVDGGGRLT